MSGFDTSQLRVLGSVGEPIAPEIWKWYYDMMGKEEAFVTDVRWKHSRDVVALQANTSWDLFLLDILAN